MAKMMELEVKNKKYLIGFSNRASVLKAEREGFMKVLNETDNAPVEGVAKLLRLGMLEKQPKITLSECNQILDDYIEENIKELSSYNKDYLKRILKTAEKDIKSLNEVGDYTKKKYEELYNKVQKF